jgi:hypothetical protein
MPKIKKLDVWEFYDTKEEWVGYDRTSIPEATPKNMFMLMNKINELTSEVNKLRKKRR